MRPGIWKRALRSVAGSLATAMLMTEPMAYADYRRSTAEMKHQWALDVGKQVIGDRKPAPFAVSSRGSVVGDPAASGASL
jgi:hypothetical protein